MTKFFTSLVLVLFSIQLKAIEPTTTATAYEHLLEVNAQWVHYKNSAPQVEISFRNEDERIKFHLQNVIYRLLEEDLPADKAALLDKLWQYAERQSFPVNLGHEERRPYFIDYQDTHCAVGYLMKESGHGQLAQRIRQEYNYDYIEDIRTEGIPEWAKEFDFTPEELAWIQPGYPVSTVFSPLLGTLNGAVNLVDKPAGSDELFLAGEFNTVDGTNCLSNVAFYNGSSIECVECGLLGLVNHMAGDGGVYMEVSGDLTINGEHYPAGYFNVDTAFGLSITNRPDAVGLAFSVYGLKRYVAIEGQLEGWVEIWEKNWNSTVWQMRASMAGTLNGLHGGNSGIMAYGAFDTVVVNLTSFTDTSFSSSVAFTFSTLSGSIPVMSFPRLQLSDTLKCAFTNGSVTYLGGFSEDGPILVRYLNGVIQPLIYASENHPYKRDVRSITWYDQNNLLVGGDFNLYPQGIGYFGRNLALYNPGSNGLSPLGAFSEPVNSSVKFSDNWYVGGEFSDSTIHYIARMENPTGISESGIEQVSVQPNPFIDNLTVSVPSNWSGKKTIKLFSMQGVLVHEETSTRPNSKFNLDGLATGSYVLTVVSEHGTSSSVVIKK